MHKDNRYGPCECTKSISICWTCACTHAYVTSGHQACLYRHHIWAHLSNNINNKKTIYTSVYCCQNFIKIEDVLSSLWTEQEATRWRPWQPWTSLQEYLQQHGLFCQNQRLKLHRFLQWNLGNHHLAQRQWSSCHSLSAVHAHTFGWQSLAVWLQLPCILRMCFSFVTATTVKLCQWN